MSVKKVPTVTIKLVGIMCVAHIMNSIIMLIVKDFAVNSKFLKSNFLYSDSI